MSSKPIDPEILRFKELDSTNAKAKELIRTGIAEEGSVVIAERQTAGRGSSGRVWHSPPGGLYLSAVFTPKNCKRPTDFSLLSGAALTQAVVTLMPKAVDVTVKWPNDCLVSWKKVGGVLCETIEHQEKNYAIIGIGLNVNVGEQDLEQFNNNLFKASSLKIECAGTDLNMERVTDVLLKKLFNLYSLYDEEGFAPIQYLWEKNCRFIGKKISLREKGWTELDYNKGLGTTVGTCLGIDEDGSIVLSNERGDRRNYSTGEISCFWL